MNQGRLQNSLAAIVRQIVALTHPQRILLFGSAATGKWRPDSDLDLLIVVDDTQQPDSVLDLLNTRVRRTAVPCDFLVATTSTIQRQRGNPGLVYGAILKEGRVVYAS
jgi:predicted nucleotidyltransferase